MFVPASVCIGRFVLAHCVIFRQGKMFGANIPCGKWMRGGGAGGGGGEEMREEMRGGDAGGDAGRRFVCQ